MNISDNANDFAVLMLLINLNVSGLLQFESFFSPFSCILWFRFIFRFSMKLFKVKSNNTQAMYEAFCWNSISYEAKSMNQEPNWIRRKSQSNWNPRKLNFRNVTHNCKGSQCHYWPESVNGCEINYYLLAIKSSLVLGSFLISCVKCMFSVY